MYLLSEHCYFGKGAFKGVNVGNCAILQNSNDFIEFVCSDIEFWFWFWFCNWQDSFTNMIADGSAWCLMCQFRLK